jgi:hypothetical protein
MQKIKYPVGSKLKNENGEIYIIDLTKNEFACLVSIKSEGFYNGQILTQKELEEHGYTLVSSPRWIPNYGSYYWTIDSYGKIDNVEYKGDSVDSFRLKTDNIFQTRQECQKKIDEINSREI